MEAQVKEKPVKKTSHLQTGWKTITPEISTELLKHNTHNRPISRREVERLKRVLSTPGQWKRNGETVKFDTNGVLQDGQTRLTAIAESGITADLFIITDLEPDAFSTIDAGRKRTGGDILYMRGIKRYNAGSVACATIYRLFKNRPIYGAVDPIPPFGIEEIIERHPGIERSLEYCAQPHNQGDVGVLGLGHLTAFHYLMESVLGEPDKASSFVEGLTQGTGLEEESPILQFRRRVLSAGRRKDAMQAQAKSALVAKVAGLHLQSQSVKTLTQPQTSASYYSLIPGLEKAVEALPDYAAMRDLPH